ncbi:MAG: hypothetical protein ABSD97_05505 [Acidimicrobiales bacterium]
MFLADKRGDRTPRLSASWRWGALLTWALVVVSFFGTGVAQALVARLLPTGARTVTLKVQYRSGGSSSFSGTFVGKPLQGQFESTDSSMTKKLCPSDGANDAGTTFTYVGKYAGTPYTFSGCVVTSPAVAKMSFRMTGKIGAFAMSGRTVGGVLTATEWTLPFKGSVGGQTVTGTAILVGGGDSPNGVSTLTARLKIGP